MGRKSVKPKIPGTTENFDACAAGENFEKWHFYKGKKFYVGAEGENFEKGHFYKGKNSRVGNLGLGILGILPGPKIPGTTKNPPPPV